MTYTLFPEPLDADAPLGKEYVFEVALKDGDALIGGTAELVDRTSSFPEPTPLLELSEISIVYVPGVSGNVWGVQCRARGLSAGSGEAFIRFEYETALGNGDHATRRIIVEQR